MGLFEVGYSSAAHSTAEKMCQLAVQTGPATSTGIDRRYRGARAHPRRQNTGVNTIALTPTSSKYTLYKHFHHRQEPRLLICMHASALKHNTAPNKNQHHLSITSSTVHPSIICPSSPSVFFPSSSVPSAGPVQSESLVELRLSLLISKSCLFHLSKCLHSQLLYEEADKGCLLSTADSPPYPPNQCGCSCVFIRLHHICKIMCERLYL